MAELGRGGRVPRLELAAGDSARRGLGLQAQGRLDPPLGRLSAYLPVLLHHRANWRAWSTISTPTISLHAARSCLVIGPGLASPMGRLSTTVRGRTQ